MATITIEGNRISVAGNQFERREALLLAAAGVRKNTESIYLPLNLLTWHQLTDAFPVEAHDYSMELLAWRAYEESVIEVGEAVNAQTLVTWDQPDLWEWQAQAKARLGLGSCAIFDDRGMGKTRTVVEAIRDDQSHSQRTAVVVCAKRLRHVWEAAITMWWGSEHWCSPTGSTWAKAASQVGGTTVTILTYDSLLSDLVHQAVVDLDPEWLVIDEAHNLKKRNRKDRKSKRLTKSGAARSLPGRKRVAISGSPMPNVWHEVWPLLNMVAPDVFGSFWQFAEVLGQIHLSHWGGKEISKEIRRHDIWQEIFDRWIVKRDRPDDGKIWDFVPVELGFKERQAYTQMQDEMRSELDGMTLDSSTVLSQMTRLQQLAGGLGKWETWEDEEGRVRSRYRLAAPSAKTDTLVHMVDGLHRAVVFTRFRDRANFVAGKIGDETESVPLVISGGTTEAQTTAALTRFASDDPANLVAVCVYGTISEGVNELVAAHDVFFLDWTTAKDVTQAADRLDRPGQDRMVRCVTLYSEGTIDEAAIDRESGKVKPLREILRSPAGWKFLIDPMKKK